MARRRSVERESSTVEGLPAEFLDPESKVWASVSASSKWLDRHGLDVDLEVLKRGPASRHRAAVEAWALANDWSKEWCSANSRLVPDGARLREAGVRLNASATLVERLQAAGVKVE